MQQYVPNQSARGSAEPEVHASAAAWMLHPRFCTNLARKAQKPMAPAGLPRLGTPRTGTQRGTPSRSCMTKREDVPLDILTLLVPSQGQVGHLSPRAARPTMALGPLAILRLHHSDPAAGGCGGHLRSRALADIRQSAVLVEDHQPARVQVQTIETGIQLLQACRQRLGVFSSMAMHGSRWYRQRWMQPEPIAYSRSRQPSALLTRWRNAHPHQMRDYLMVRRALQQGLTIAWRHVDIS